MAVKLPSGFIITTNEPIDDRLVLTKEQMKAKPVGQMPDYYFAVCKEDKRIYIYDKSIQKDQEDPETGKFKPLENFLDFSSPAAQDKFEQALASSTKFSTLETTVGDASKVGSLVYNVNELKTDVTNLESSVDELEITVGDDTSGLVKRINKAQSDITVIETWINNVKLDGGEIKPKYDLTSTLVNVNPDSQNPSKIEYKTPTTLSFTAAQNHVLPETIIVNSISVGSSEVDCGNVKAKWTLEEGAGAIYGILLLTEATGEVSFTITATAA